MKYTEAGKTVSLNFEYTVNGAYVAPSSPEIRIYDSGGALKRTVGLTVASSTGKYSVGLTTADLSAGTYNAWAYGTYNGANIFSTSPELFEVLTISGEVYYASVTELRDYLSISDASADERLYEYILAASRHIDKYCRRQFRQYVNTYRRYLILPKHIMLTEYPVISVAGMTVETVGASTVTAIDTDAYHTDLDVGKITMLKKYTGNFVITYTAGMVSVPAEIRLACLKLCSFFYSKRRREGIKHESLLSYSYTLSAGAIEEVSALLDPYRLISV